MDLAPKRALVTGADGFAGRRLMERLRQDGWQAVGIDVGECDVRDAEAVARALAEARPHAVFHLAGIAFPADVAANPARGWAVNAEGTRNMLRAASRLDPPPRVVAVSSSYVLYGNPALGEKPLDESLPRAPGDAYAAGKAAAELIAESWAERGLPVMIARPFNHIGPGQHENFVASNFALQIARIEQSGAPAPIKVGNLKTRRDLTDVRDVVQGYIALAENGRAGRIYHLCSGQAVSMEALLRGLLAHARCEIPLATDPDRVRLDENPVIQGDPARMQDEIGWTARIPLSRTLGDILEDARLRVRQGA